MRLYLQNLCGLSFYNSRLLVLEQAYIAGWRQAGGAGEAEGAGGETAFVFLQLPVKMNGTGF